MGFVSDPSFHALHVVRIRGRAPVETVRAALGRDDVIDLLRSLAADGHVEYKTGRATGWAVTAAGRAAHADLVAAEREAAGVDAAVRRCYDAFVGLNPSLIAACSAYQLRSDGSINDHTDADYDAGVVAQLGVVHEQIEPVCRSLTDVMDRFGGYGDRLEAALVKVRDGDGQWFTGVMVDSYHTVWFELHEDLLQTLGLDRAAEGAG